MVAQQADAPSPYNLELRLTVPRKIVLVRIPQLPQLRHVQGVNAINLLLVRNRRPLDAHRPPDNDVNRAAVRHEANVVVEHTAAMQRGQGELEDAEAQHLEAMHHGVCLRAELVVERVLAKPKHGHEVGAGTDGHFDETLAGVEDHTEGAGFGFERLARAADDYRHSAAGTLAVTAAARQDVPDGLLGDGAEAHGEEPVAVEGDAEVGVKRHKCVGHAGELLSKAEGIRTKGHPGAVGDYAVRVVAEYVLRLRVKVVCLVQLRREVTAEQTPHGQRAQGLGAVFEAAVGGGCGDGEVDKIRDQEGPGERVRADEEEYGGEKHDGGAVEEDSERLQAAHQRDVQRREADAGLGPRAALMVPWKGGGAERRVVEFLVPGRGLAQAVSVHVREVVARVGMVVMGQGVREGGFGGVRVFMDRPSAGLLCLPVPVGKCVGGRG